MKKLGFILITVFLLLVIIFALKIYFSKSNASPNIWAIDDCYKVRPDNGKIFSSFIKGDYKRRNEIWDAENKVVSLQGAKNEYLGFQIIIEAQKEDLKDIDIEITDFQGPAVISKDNISLFKEHYTAVKKKSGWPKPSTGLGEYPDALIPFHIPEWGAPFSIKKGRNQAVWVDIYIPKEIEAGEYMAKFSVKADNFPVTPIKVKLLVWDFMLPDENHLKAWSNYELISEGYKVEKFSPDFFQIEKNILKLCHQHRLEALHRHTIVRPKLKKERGDYFTIDWAPYEERLGTFLSGSLFENKQPPSMFLFPVNTWPGQRWPKDESLLQRVCQEMAAYFKEKGWDLSRGYIYLWDEPEEKDLGELKKWAKLVKDAAPELKTTVAFMNNFNKKALDELLPYVDLWLVDAEKVNLKLFRELKQEGKEIGFYQQGEPWCGNENLDTDGLGFRTWPWIAFKYDIDVIYLYHMTNWQRVQNKGTIWKNPRSPKWSNSQGVLLYPGGYINTHEAIGSLRLKQLRRGMQDYEYMYLAKAKGADPESIVNTIIVRALDETKRLGGSYGEWSRNPSDWFIARENLAHLILGEKLTPMKSVRIPPARISGGFSSLGLSIKNSFRSCLNSSRKALQFVYQKVNGMFKFSGTEKFGKKRNRKMVHEDSLAGPIKISIYPTKEKRKVSRLLYGSNLEPKMESDFHIWNFIKNIGISCLRFPGGDSPGWHWKTGVADFNNKVKNMPFSSIDYLIEFCKKVNTKIIMQVNIETGTPQEAAELVEYMNKKAGFRVEYWELGNEVYGDWDKGYTTPEKYAQLIKEYSLAMKAKDPTIKIGADWGGKFYDEVKWDETLIKYASDYIDFVSVHWYPNHIGKRHPQKGRVQPLPEEVMANSLEIPNMVQRLNRIIEKEAPQRKGKIEITFLEWDGAWGAPLNDPKPPYAQGIAQWSLANALFHADSLGQFAENGITVSTQYSLQECSFGLIRGWDPAEGWGGMEWDIETIRPKAFAIELFSKHFGDTVIENQVENSPSYDKAKDNWPDSYTGRVPYVSCYASKFSNDNKLGIIFINKHPKQDFKIKVLIEEAAKVNNVGDIWLLTGPVITAQNDGLPESVKIEKLEAANISNNFIYTLPAHSVIAMEIKLDQ